MLDYISKAFAVVFNAQGHNNESANLVFVQMLNALALRVGFADARRGKDF